MLLWLVFNEPLLRVKEPRITLTGSADVTLAASVGPRL